LIVDIYFLEAVDDHLTLLELTRPLLEGRRKEAHDLQAFRSIKVSKHGLVNADLAFTSLDP
jgi:hypothetical protein